MTYQNEDPTAFMKSQGWQFKAKGRELVTECPLCAKPEHLYMNADTGLWKCHRCGETGNLYQLRRRLGLQTSRGNVRQDGITSFGQTLNKTPPKKIPVKQVEDMHAALLKDSEALDYCTKGRYWVLEVIKAVKIGLRKDARGKWLAFPWWRKGECIGLKYRILPAHETNFPARFEREAGCESILFNIDALDRFEEIILVSGESDAISLLTLGLENVVATTIGESSLPAAAVEALMKKSKISILYDNDATGQKGGMEVAKRVGLDRSYLVRLPPNAHDVNDFLIKGGTREAFEELLATAKEFDVPSISSLAQALDKLEEEKSFGDWDQLDQMTPWPAVNGRIGKWWPGNLIVVSGPQGTGKTTLVLNIASFWASKGFPALVYCLEMGIWELVQHVLCAHYQKTEEGISTQLINQARRDLSEWPFYLGVNPRASGIKEILELLRQAVRRYGLKLVVFDNLHMLARSIDRRSEEVGAITKGFKLLAMELEIPVILIAQPRKLEPGKVMTNWDLKDSVDIFSDADQIILLHRELIGGTNDRVAIAGAERGAVNNLDPKTLIRIGKSRHMASTDTLLYFEGDKHRFREIKRGD
jgi:archaellum biogenesis ATPase FlaH